MIKNERQYMVSKTQVARLESTLAQMINQSDEESAIHPILRKAQEDALRSQIKELRQQIEEYESLRTGERNVIKAESLEDLPNSLIKARIASGMTQKALAEKLGLKEQQIQRYEATGYSGASLTRIAEIANALNLDIPFILIVRNHELTQQRLVQRLSRIGLKQDFILKRLVPWSFRLKEDRKVGSVEVLHLVQAIQRIYGWGVDSILGTEPLKLDYPAVAGAKFKRSISANEQQLSAYTFYSHYIAMLVGQATKHLTLKPLPTDPYDVRRAILTRFGTISLKSCLRYVWDLGIPVIPLDDPGAFHGACFREDGRNAIVIKQKTSSLSRWMFDLMHELWHASQEPEYLERIKIDTEDVSYKRDADEEEVIASRFAGAVLLGERANAIAEMCMREADQDLSRLKSTVQGVAKRENIEVDSLANYLAFLLSLRGHNWWGTAENLQEKGENPWQIARDILFECVDFSKLADTDVELLRQALAPWEDIISDD